MSEFDIGIPDPAIQVGTCFILDGVPRVVVAIGEDDDGPMVAHVKADTLTWARAEVVMECPEVELPEVTT